MQVVNHESVDAPRADQPGANGGQYLTFIMAGEEYGVDILCVQEIRGWESATPIPNSPPNIKGVINLRGTIVPIVDLRQCFGLAAIEYTPITVVIVVKIQTGHGSRIMGIVVDAVSDVYNIADSDVKPAPDLGDAVETQFVKGLVAINSKMVILLELEKLLDLREAADFTRVRAAAAAAETL
jgi:purine-binding chemotaxis protein CheW